MEKRRRGQVFEFALLGVLLLLFAAILLSLVGFKPAPEVITLVGGWGGTVLAMIGMIVSFQFGSSKGSQIKDQMMADKPNPPVPPAQPEGT